MAPRAAKLTMPALMPAACFYENQYGLWVFMLFGLSTRKSSNAPDSHKVKLQDLSDWFPLSKHSVHVSPVRRGRLLLLLVVAVVMPASVVTGGNCIKIGLPGKLILSERKGLWEVILS